MSTINTNPRHSIGLYKHMAQKLCKHFFYAYGSNISYVIIYPKQTLK